MGAIRYYLPVEKIRNFLSSRKFYGFDYFLATIFGAITPFCSCSSIPLFIGFLRAGIPIGVTFSFLITSPLINEIALVLFLGIFGWKITLGYLLAGIVIGMISGFIISQLNMERYVAKFVQEQTAITEEEIKSSRLKIKKIIKISLQEGWRIVKEVAPYIIIGVGVGAIIHGYVPQDIFEKYLGQAGWLGVPIAVVLAVPLYSNPIGVIPIIEALVLKGIPLGTALAFMMAIVGLSLPQAMMLKKVLKWPLLLSFFLIVTLGIILIGYIFNFLY